MSEKAEHQVDPHQEEAWVEASDSTGREYFVEDVMCRELRTSCCQIDQPLHTTGGKTSSTKPVDECSHCGARGDRMHTRDACPAKDQDCYNCGTALWVISGGCAGNRTPHMSPVT